MAFHNAQVVKEKQQQHQPLYIYSRQVPPLQPIQASVKDLDHPCSTVRQMREQNHAERG